MKKMLALVLALAMALSLVPAMAEGNVLRYGTETEPAGFDPHTISSHASIRVMAQVYNTLVDVNENLEVIPELALSWEQPDELTYIFHLADNAYFHSGRKVTAEDVKYSFERILNPDLGALGNSSSYAGDIDTVEALDETTVKITLKKVNVTFLNNMTSSYCSIVDKDVVEANEGSLLRADGGSGPYTLGEWVADNHVTVNAYDKYFNEAEKATFDSIEYYVMTDASSRLNALRTGAVDLIIADTAMLDLINEGDPIQVISYQTRDYVGLFMNCDRTPYSDVRVRQAINYALDREEIIEFAYNGTAAISGFIPASMGHWAVDVSEKDYYTQNIDKAKALLAEAGYANGFDTVITVGLEDGIRDMGVVVKEQLAAIGINAEIRNEENAQYIDDWKAHNFDIMICHNGAGSDPNRGVAFFFSSTGSANIQGYSNARVDELCVLGVSTSDVAQREEYYKEAINIILDECATAIAACPMAYFLASPALKGYAPSASNTNNFAGVTLEK